MTKSRENSTWRRRATVADAYGWALDLSDDEILQRKICAGAWGIDKFTGESCMEVAGHTVRSSPPQLQLTNDGLSLVRF
ncbi:MAG TPA: hypothetical protein GYA08_06730 [Chloroflexi bacterium]|nr:hypothetical protein [Chloroflexota bacterium]